MAVLAATLSGPAAVLALLPRTLNPKLLQQLTEDISARPCFRQILCLDPVSTKVYLAADLCGVLMNHQHLG